MKASLLMAAALGATALGGCTTMDGSMGSMAQSAAALPVDSRGYMQMAHSGDMFEIESSRMAQQMARTPAVRTFADMMIADHTRMMNEMMPMAQSMGMNMASMPMAPHHTAMLDRLRSASAAEFDMMYKREQVMAHREARMLHANYAARGDNSQMKAMAARAVPMIEMHMRQAEALPGGT